MRANRTVIIVVTSIIIVIFTVIVLAFLFSNETFSLLNKNRSIIEKIVRVIPSSFLILYRYDLFNYFVLALASFILSITLVFILGYSLFAFRTRIKQKIFSLGTIIIVMALAVILPLATYSYKHAQSRLLFARGFQKMQRGQDINALELYLSAIKLTPSLPLPYIELMKVYKKNKQYQKAIEIGRQYLANGNDTQISMMLGELCSTIGDYRAAISYYTRALQIRDSPEVRYEMAKAFFMLSEYEKSMQISLNYPRNSRFLHLYGKSLFELGRNYEALNVVSDAIRLNPADPNYWYTKGKLLYSMNKDQDALKAYKQAIWLKKEFPEAYVEMGRIFFKQKNIHSCNESLRKAIYYDNTMSDVLVWLEALKKKKLFGLHEIKEDKTIKLLVPTQQLNIEKDHSVEIVVKAEVPITWNNAKIACIEPYGWGVLCDLIREDKLRQQKSLLYLAKYKITGNRDSDVNMGMPWKVNFVAFNFENGKYLSETINVFVKDNREGKIFFVLTEDLECTESPHTNDSTPHRSDLSVEEIEVDLIKKGILADKIANSIGLKWSHIVDMGSSYLMLKWLSEVSKDPGWRMLWLEMKQYLKMTAASGNDVQLHIHSYNIPDSPNFTQRYDPETNQSVLCRSTYHGPTGAWADFYTDLGYFDNDISRVGSLFRGVKLYERHLHTDFPNYRVLFFRAGEWEFGESEKEMQKSIVALRKNKILAGSNAYEGEFGRKNFSFSRRIGENIYFTRFNNIREPASSLLDIGILEILPVPELHHYSHIRPIDDPSSIRSTYNQCFNTRSKIKSGVHILMGMYHINRINFGDKRWDSLDPNYGDWLRIKRHFEDVTRYATKAQFATVCQAVVEYLDYYAPDIIALRVNEHQEGKSTYVYDIRMIGNDIPIDTTKTHLVSIKPPSYFTNNIMTISLLHNGRKIKTWNEIRSYEDLEFEAENRSGYTIRVNLKPSPLK